MNRGSRARLFAGALLGSGLLALAVAGCARPEERRELRIGLLAELASEDGEPTVQGAKLAVAAVNDAGGLELGGQRYEVALIVEDTHDRPEDAAQAALELINRHGVVALVASSRSTNAIPAARVADAAHVPVISPGSSHPDTTAGKPYAFRVTILDAFQGEVMARFAHDDLGARTAAVLYDVADVYSRSMAEVFREVFASSGGEVTAFEPYTTGTLDFRDSLGRIRKRQPEVLFLPCYTDEALRQGEQARGLGVTATFVGVDGWTPARLAAHPGFEGSYMAATWDLAFAGAYPGGEAFVVAFRRAYGRDPAYGLSALVYDAMGVLLAAVRDAGRPDPEAIRDALANVEGYPGVAGEITYRGTGGDPKKPVGIVRVRGGAVELAKIVKPGSRARETHREPLIDRERAHPRNSNLGLADVLRF